MTRELANAEIAQRSFAQLEGMIVDVLNWAEALKAIGETPSRLDPGAIAVVGRALDDLAGHMRDGWDAIHEAGGIGVPSDKPVGRSDPDRDLKLHQDCAELLAVKERSNGNDLADDDIALKALTDRDSHLCHKIVCSKAFTARGLAAKARVVARECGFDLALIGQSPVDLDDASLLITSLLRDVLRGPASADWQRSNSLWAGVSPSR